MKRGFAAILAADVVGYSAMTSRDEQATLATLSARRTIIDALIEDRNGRIFHTAGDSVIAEFGSSVEAVGCAVGIQEQMQELNASGSGADKMTFRIGVHFGDVVHEGDNMLGDGVNIAARLESLAMPGSVCISGPVAEQIRGKLKPPFHPAGRHRLKNIAKPVDVWCWPLGCARRLQYRSGSFRKAAAALAAAAVLGAGFLVYAKRSDDGSLSGPKIAVIPFEDVGNNPEDAYFSDGLTKDINAQLAKFSNLFVIAPGSTAAFRDNADCRTIRDELNADYILQGTVQRSADNLRVTTNFTDARTCRQLDAPGPFNRELNVADLLDIQLEIAAKVVAEIGSSDAPLFNTNVQADIRRKAPESLAAYECVLLSYWFYETFAPERHRKARTCLERATEIDPAYSLGWSRLAFSYLESQKYAIDTPQDWADKSRKAANRALELDPDNPDAYYALAILSQMTGADRAVFRNFAETAIKHNPNDAFVLADLGTWMAYSGAWETGKEWVSRSKLLNPKHQSWLDYIWHLKHYLDGEYEQARDVALKVNLPKNYMVQASLAAAYAMNGEQQLAEETLAHVLELRPEYPADPRAPFRTRGMPQALIEHLMDGLRKAGLDVPVE